MKSRLLRLGAVASLAVVAAPLAGCGSADPSAAAIVDGQVIKDADIATIIQDLQRVPSNESLTPNQVVGTLIAAKVVNQHASDLQAPAVSTDAVRADLEQPDDQGRKLTGWQQPTVEALRDVSVFRTVMQGKGQAKALDYIKKADIKVNPKYGQFDPATVSVSPANPNWMGTPSAQPSGPGNPGQTGRPGDQDPSGPPTTLPGGQTGAPATTGAPAPTGTGAAPATTAPAPTGAPAQTGTAVPTGAPAPGAPTSK